MQARKHARLSDLIRAGTYVYLLSFLFFLCILLLNYLGPSCVLVHKLWETHPLLRHCLHIPTHQHLLMLIVSVLIIMYPRDYLHHLLHLQQLQLRYHQHPKNTDNTMPTINITQICPDLSRLRVGYLMEPDRALPNPNPALGRWWQVLRAV